MKLIDVDLVDEPVTFDKYKILGEDELPGLFLGFYVRNKYDEERLRIHPKYNAQRIMHVCYDQFERATTRCLYGVHLKPRPAVKELITILDEHTAGRENLDPKVYQMILHDSGLDCESCFQYLCTGLYPIDCLFLKSVAYYGHLNLKEFVDLDDFQSFAALTIYVLGNHMAYYEEAHNEIIKEAYQ